MIRDLAELGAYGAFATMLVAASLSPAQDIQIAPSSATARASAVMASGAALEARGRQLFSAKGCVGCHTHATVAGSHMAIGPDLTGLPERAGSRVQGQDAVAYVRQSIREPGRFVVPGYSGVAMPDLHLSDIELDALVAFVLRR